MKIVRLKINGIRGFGFGVDRDTQEETPHWIELSEGNSILLFGENGTGKSSFFDAVEWALTGQIEEEAKHRKIDTKEFLRHSYCTDGQVPNVEITFNNEVVYQRRLSGRNEVFEFQDIAPYHFIETNRITVFVTDTRKNLWERFLDLVGLNDLLEAQTQLKYAKSAFESELKEIKNKIFAVDSEFQKYNEQRKGLENTLNNRYDSDWQNQSFDNEKLMTKRDDLTSLVNAIKKGIENKSKYEELKTESETLNNKLNELRVNFIDADLSSLLETAEQYFIAQPNAEICPVCNEKTINQAIISNITDRRKRLSEIIEVEKKYERVSEDFPKSKAEVEKNIAALFERLNLENMLTGSLDEKFNIVVAKSKTIETELETLKKTIQIQLDSDFKNYNYVVSNIEKNQNQRDKLTKEASLKEDAFQDYKQYFDSFKRRYEQILKDELENISTNYVSEIYNQLNETDNEIIDSFRIEYDIENQEIKFVAKLKNSENEIDPITILSTGHLRCLGFALLMSRILKKNSPLKFIAIDDPIYAIDHEHRYSLINYLSRISNDFQLIITTSDRNFWDIFRNKLGIQRLKTCEARLQFSHSSPHSVIVEPKSKNFLDNAKAHLRKNDYRASAFYSRLYLETILFDTATKLRAKIKVQIGRQNDISIDEIFSCVKQNLHSKYPDKQSDIDRAFEEISNNRYFGSLKTNTPLNKEIHQTTEISGFLNTKMEIEEIIATTEQFANFIKNLTS